MTKRFQLGRTLNQIRMASAAALLTVVVPLALGQTTTAQSGAPTTSDDALIQKAVFEVASIRPEKPGPDGRGFSRFGYTPNGRLTAIGITLKRLLCLAYDVNEFEIVGAPAWLDSERYTVEAKADSAIEEQLAKLSPVESRLAGQHMVRTMLADRLGLKMHQEIRPLPILAIVPAKNGPKLHESTPGDTYSNGLKDREGHGHAGMMRFSNGKLTAQGVPLDNLASQLTEQLHQIVQNKTGLKGNYDFSLEWTPEQDHDTGAPIGSGEPGGSSAADSSGPSIYTAIQEQLGLKLEAQKSAVPVYVIDQVERPSEN